MFALESKCATFEGKHRTSNNNLTKLSTLYHAILDFNDHCKEGFENIVGKGENAGYQCFLLISQCFLSYERQISAYESDLIGHHNGWVQHYSKCLYNL